MHDQPIHDRRRGGDALSWRLGELERHTSDLHKRIHELEAGEAANRHLLGMIAATDTRVDALERDLIETAARHAGFDDANRDRDRGLSRREKTVAIVAGLGLFGLQLLQTFHTIIH